MVQHLWYHQYSKVGILLPIPEKNTVLINMFFIMYRPLSVIDHFQLMWAQTLNIRSASVQKGRQRCNHMM